MPKKKPTGLRKRCTCGRRRWDGCDHPWHYRVKLAGKRHRVNLNAHFKVVGVVSRHDAEELADRYRVEARTPTPTEAPVTLADVADRFERAFPTKKHYYLAILREALGPKAMADITADDIEDAAEARRKKASKGANGGLDAKRHVLTVARHLFSWAMKRRLIRETPFRFEGVTVITIPVSRRRDRRVSHEEETRLLAATDPHTADVIVAALQTACRVGELQSLQWRDVLDDAIVLQAAKTKTRRRRAIRISPTLRKVLDRRQLDPNGEPLGPDAHVFGNALGEPVKQSLIGSRFRAACTRAKLDGLHFHDLRHEAASRFLEAGAALHEVQAILGHTNIQQTSTYLNASDEDLSAAMEKRHQADMRRTLHAVTR